MNITKKLNSKSMTEHKTDMNITKYNTNHDKAQSRHEHYSDMNITEKLNSTSTVEYKTDMNMTEKLSSTFSTEH